MRKCILIFKKIKVPVRKRTRGHNVIVTKDRSRTDVRKYSPRGPSTSGIDYLLLGYMLVMLSC